jgi:methylated-DNA-protein-cysteine methyltransferase-like protein
MTLCCIFFSMPRSMFAEILAQVRRVPRGKVATYGDIAYAAGYPGSARQVAWALHTSSSGLPWHRIVGADGKILLPGEAGFEQRMRLQSEGVQFHGLRIDMAAHRHSFFTKEKSTKEKSAKKSITAAQRRYKNARHDGAGK